MSTASEAAPAVHTVPFTLTRGGAYLIEGILQRTEYTTSVPLTRRAARLWVKLRKLNSTKTEHFDWERELVRNSKESDIEWAQRQVDRKEFFEKWQNESVVLPLTQRESDFLRTTALKWAFKNRDKVFQVNNNHVLSIIEAFNPEDDGEEQ